MRVNLLAVLGGLTFAVTSRADVVLATNTAGTPTSGTGVLNNTGTGGTVNTNLTYGTTTYSGSASGGLMAVNQTAATAGWNLTGVGAFTNSPSSFIVSTSATGSAISVASSQSLSDFYLIFNLVKDGSYNFSNWGGTVSLVGGTSGKVSLAGKTVTISGIDTLFGPTETDGFMVRFTGSNLTSGGLSFTGLTNDGLNNSLMNFGVAVPEPGTLLLGGIAAVSGGTGVFWKRRKKAAEAAKEIVTV